MSSRLAIYPLGDPQSYLVSDWERALKLYQRTESLFDPWELYT
jgi:hypothetical protein